MEVSNDFIDHDLKILKMMKVIINNYHMGFFWRSSTAIRLLKKAKTYPTVKTIMGNKFLSKLEREYEFVYDGKESSFFIMPMY